MWTFLPEINVTHRSEHLSFRLRDGQSVVFKLIIIHLDVFELRLSRIIIVLIKSHILHSQVLIVIVEFRHLLFSFQMTIEL